MYNMYKVVKALYIIVAIFLQEWMCIARLDIAIEGLDFERVIDNKFLICNSCYNA